MRESYPYGGPAFDRFVHDSYDVAGAGNADTFYRWMDRAAGGKSGHVSAVLDARAPMIRTPRTDAERSLRQIQAAAWLHGLVKRAIPRFSLDRGFEFTGVVRYGERQCLLQSVLIAGMLQRMGADAGTVMVYRNERGEFSNNGHAVTLLKLPSGKDIMVDASDTHPHGRHLGLYAVLPNGGYGYVVPVFAPGSSLITGYRSAAGRRGYSTRSIRMLDTAFLRSQFAYYRGERVPGGPASTRKTVRGYQTAARYLKASVAACPRNPLSVYMLGRVDWYLGDKTVARRNYRAAYRLYAQAGWVPPGLKDALREARG